MNIKTLKKIEEGRKLFPKFEVKKNGRNTYQNFKYFKLDDLLPVDRAICTELKLFTKLNEEDEHNIKLEVYDLEQDDEQEPVIFNIPACSINNSNITLGSQEHGNVQTYSWRYLLYQLWCISEEDITDSVDINKLREEQNEVSSERLQELAAEIGKSLYERGLDNTDKSVLNMELNQRLRDKKITTQEYDGLGKMIN